MQIHRNEVTTGILALVSLGILGAVLVVIGMPGVIKPLNTFRIYYDNVSGLRPGDPVLLGGRQIGQVTRLESPVPMADRPQGHPDYEVLIEVNVDKAASVRSRVTARLSQQGLMGQLVIDFVQGEETSPLATDNSVFVGERVPQISELAAVNLERLTGDNSDLALTMKNTREFTATIKREPWRLFWKSEQAAGNLDRLTGSNSDLAATLDNTRQLTETIKREPWRLVWKSDSPAQ